MFPAGAAGLSATLATLAVVDTTTAGNTAAGSVSLTVPTVQDGDLLILQCFGWYGVSAATFSNISGWTTITNVTAVGGGTTHASLHYRIASASDSGASVSGGAEAGGSGSFRFNCKSLLVVRANLPIASVIAGSVNSEWHNGASGSPAAQTVTISGAAAPLIVVGSYTVTDTGVAVNPRTFTVGGVGAKDSELQGVPNASNDVWIAWKSFNAGASLATPVVVDMDDNGSAMTLLSCYIACT